MTDNTESADGRAVMRRLWEKDHTLWKDDEAAKKNIENSLGWLRMPEEMPSRIGEMSAFTEEARKRFKHVLLLGMGGSSLAPEVLRQAFGPREGYPVLHVLDSTEPETVARAREEADPKDTLYIVASKSGTTTEPLRFMDYFWGQVKAAGITPGENFAAITDPGSHLESYAKEHGFRKVFLNFPDIGGRYSALSYFGMVAASLAGIDVKELFKRARAMMEGCSPESLSNPGFILGDWLGTHALQGRDKVTFLVSKEIAGFGLWLEQLIAESTGKEGKGVVPVTGEPSRLKDGTYGEDRVFVHIKLNKSKDRGADSAAKQLLDAGRPVTAVKLVDPLDLGAEFFRWEIATAVLGHRLGINPFDQPDVQSAKSKTKALMEEFRAKKRLPEPETHVQKTGITLSFSKASWTRLKDCSTVDEGLSRFMEDSKEGDYIGLLSYLCSDGRYEKALDAIRKSAARRGSLAIQSGYGPRYLHSTGQLHKGGPNSGIFVILTRPDAPDVTIHAAGYSFGQLVAAQALGDFQALDEAGRRAVLIRVEGKTDKALKRVAKAIATKSADPVIGG